MLGISYNTGIDNLAHHDTFNFVSQSTLLVMPHSKLLFRIRAMILLFVVLLVLSGITAFPVYTEMKWLMSLHIFNPNSAMGAWLEKVWLGVQEMNERRNFMFYGYDWMAFAHIVIGSAFIGPFRDPVRNKWIIDWAMLACIGVFPLALIAGPIRDIPWFHILIDCSFGVFGMIPLLIVRGWIKKLEKITASTTP
jgi:hypothetical protein